MISHRSDLPFACSGVLQGSIIGPLLPFSLQVNDFRKVMKYFSVRLFVDDSSLTVSGEVPCKLFQ